MNNAADISITSEESVWESTDGDQNIRRTTQEISREA